MAYVQSLEPDPNFPPAADVDKAFITYQAGQWPVPNSSVTDYVVILSTEISEADLNPGT